MHPKFTLSIAFITLLGASLGAGCTAKVTPAATSKTPTKKTTTKPTPAQAKGASKPVPAAAKPGKPTTPPANPPAKPTTPPTGSANAGQLDSDAIEFPGTCADYNLEEGKGFCSEDYLFGCEGGKVKALDCGGFNSAELSVSCIEGDTTVQCEGIDLTTVDTDIVDDLKAFAVGDGTCPAVQNGKGACVGTFIAACIDGVGYAIDCGSYGDGVTCGKTAAGAITCGQ
jgi:hypothetical protein